jgi:predicted dehydrogenase
MMAETVVYSREFLFIREMLHAGELGEVQYMQASHPQDMDGWPEYWERMIPMHYATHVVSPVLGLLDKRAEYVSCFGSGVVREHIAQKSGNRFAVETCHIKLANSNVAAHIWRFLYDVARQYRESFDVYGTKKSFEWTLVEHEPHVIHTAKKPEPEIPEKITVPDFAHLLPESIRRFTMPQEIHDSKHLSFIQGGGHGGSHPHLVNEFVSALLEDRDPWPNATQSANWTCVGICAHQSAEKGGEIVHLPKFTLA